MYQRKNKVVINEHFVLTTIQVVFEIINSIKFTGRNG